LKYQTYIERIMEMKTTYPEEEEGEEERGGGVEQ
jgi:hypothetical protein